MLAFANVNQLTCCLYYTMRHCRDMQSVVFADSEISQARSPAGKRSSKSRREFAGRVWVLGIRARKEDEHSLRAAMTVSSISEPVGEALL